MTDKEYAKLHEMLEEIRDNQQKKDYHLSVLVTNIFHAPLDGDLHRWAKAMQEYCLNNNLIKKVDPT